MFCSIISGPNRKARQQTAAPLAQPPSPNPHGGNPAPAPLKTTAKPSSILRSASPPPPHRLQSSRRDPQNPHLGFGMGNKATEEQVALVRSIVGPDPSSMDIIRALHMANNNPAAAINILFDTPAPARIPTSPPPAITLKRRPDTPAPARIPTPPSPAASPGISLKRRPDTPAPAKIPTPTSPAASPAITLKRRPDNPKPAAPVPVSEPGGSVEGDGVWWLVGTSELPCLSTCKGRRINVGDRVTFSFPSERSWGGKSGGRGRAVVACSEIVRFSTAGSGEIGRIPNEWARCFSPLVREKKIKIEGCCKTAPEILGIMDTVLLSISVFINSSVFRTCHQTSLKATRFTSEESTVHPLPSLFRLLGLTPIKKAEFTPEDFYIRKRPLEPKDSSGMLASVLPAEKYRKLSSNGSKVEDENLDISDSDLNSIVGTADCSELEEMTPPDSLQCELRPYQKQALYWMMQMEKGGCLEEAATTLHPCWNAYRLADKREPIVYINSFSGDVTTEFPSTLQIARGGILADAMGLGKTIMTLALLLAHSDKGGFSASPTSQAFDEVSETCPDRSPSISKKSPSSVSFSKLLKSKTTLVGGGNLIVCPMTLLGQWKAEVETHAQPGSLTIYVHYGQSRAKDAKFLAERDVVLTTYGVLASEFSSENAEENGGLYSVRWFRIILDEAHTIKSSKSQVSIAASALSADRRWCLTGTPIQNNLEDIYSLLRFLRVEPWGNWGLWHKLIQKPYEEGDERGLKLVQSILKPLMLRRTKSSKDREGRTIVVLPPANVEVIYCELTAAEKDFYEALFKRSKVKFDEFVEQGRVLHNYASILELLLRLRQCCDHPFLVMSRGDTQEFADLNKLAKRFLKDGKDADKGDTGTLPSKAYIQEVVDELRKGEEGECPICLEAFEDAVLTPCAHRLCRECLFASWRSATTGLCPVCRNSITKQDLITAPTDSRFRVDVEKNWVESSKVSVLMQELERLRESGSKSIIFSQWTAFLDLLQIPLSRSKLLFLRLDGTLSQQQREKVINQFTEDNSILVLLMSLKAGGVGINLTAACNAFLLDPWWNPAVEEQAVMRIHRIGQTKSVSIKRFIVKGTVEDRMEAVKARKQKMISGALTDQEVRTARIEELKMLFT